MYHRLCLCVMFQLKNPVTGVKGGNTFDMALGRAKSCVCVVFKS